MKIICTKEEKEALINAYECKPKLPCCFPSEMSIYDCKNKYKTCKDCLEQNIEWEIKEKKEE